MGQTSGVCLADTTGRTGRELAGQLGGLVGGLREPMRGDGPGGDAIDFACAPNWASAYARQGLTRDYPPEYYWSVDLEEEVAHLRAEVARLRAHARPGYLQEQWRAQVQHINKRIDALATAKAREEEGGFDL